MRIEEVYREDSTYPPQRLSWSQGLRLDNFRFQYFCSRKSCAPDRFLESVILQLFALITGDMVKNYEN